jgi:hypothetical protein
MAFDAWGYSWGGPFTRFVRWGAAESVSPKTYGPPFADFSLAMPTTIDRLHKMQLSISAGFPSARIDINGESEP